jgi:putative transposase
MKRSKYSEEQITYAIRQAESGTPVGDVCRQLGISEATFYVWKKKFAHLGVSELRRLRPLEEENARLKGLGAATEAHGAAPRGGPSVTFSHCGRSSDSLGSGQHTSALLKR